MALGGEKLGVERALGERHGTQRKVVRTAEQMEQMWELRKMKSINALNLEPSAAATKEKPPSSSAAAVSWVRGAGHPVRGATWGADVRV